jgi:hypothetical protein
MPAVDVGRRLQTPPAPVPNQPPSTTQDCEADFPCLVRTAEDERDSLISARCRASAMTKKIPMEVLQHMPLFLLCKAVEVSRGVCSRGDAQAQVDLWREVQEAQPPRKRQRTAAAAEEPSSAGEQRQEAQQEPACAPADDCHQVRRGPPRWLRAGGLLRCTPAPAPPPHTHTPPPPPLPRCCQHPRPARPPPPPQDQPAARRSPPQVQTSQQLRRAASLQAAAKATRASRSPSPTPTPCGAASPCCDSGAAGTATTVTTATTASTGATERGSPASCDTGYGYPLAQQQARGAAAPKHDVDIYGAAPLQQPPQLLLPIAFHQGGWYAPR